jgi:hypothetical protein
MRLELTVVAENTRSGVKGTTAWEMTELSVVDASKGVARCATPFRITLEKSDADLKGKLQDQRIMLDCTEVRPGFKGGPIELRGHIVRQK